MLNIQRSICTLWDNCWASSRSLNRFSFPSALTPTKYLELVGSGTPTALSSLYGVGLRHGDASLGPRLGCLSILSCSVTRMGGPNRLLLDPVRHAWTSCRRGVIADDRLTLLGNIKWGFSPLAVNPNSTHSSHPLKVPQCYHQVQNGAQMFLTYHLSSSMTHVV